MSNNAASGDLLSDLTFESEMKKNKQLMRKYMEKERDVALDKLRKETLKGLTDGEAVFKNITPYEIKEVLLSSRTNEALSLLSEKIFSSYRNDKEDSFGWSRRSSDETSHATQSEPKKKTKYQQKRADEREIEQFVKSELKKDESNADYYLESEW